jgi:mono/diheme cytochrome c family protein
MPRMSHVRRVLGVAITAAAIIFLITASVSIDAQTPATVQDGVFSDAQATRGQALYTQRCAGCHGPALQGAQAPPLAGDAFVRKFRTEPLSALFIKIRYTMPPTTPPNAAAAAQLTPEQGADLVAHVLKANGFPAGKTDFAAADATTSRVAWPAPPATEAPSAVAARHTPTGTLNQLMRGIFFPNSNLLFTVQTRDPAAPVPPPDPAAKGAGFSVFEWGQGIYTGWPVIENAAAAIADASPWMLTPGLRCENGRLAPVTEPDWIRFTEQMVSVAKRGYRLAQTKNQEAVSEWTGDLSDACAACHSVYREVGGRGRGANPLAPGVNPARCTHR